MSQPSLLPRVKRCVSMFAISDLENSLNQSCDSEENNIDLPQILKLHASLHLPHVHTLYLSPSPTDSIEVFPSLLSHAMPYFFLYLVQWSMPFILQHKELVMHITKKCWYTEFVAHFIGLTLDSIERNVNCHYNYI